MVLSRLASLLRRTSPLLLYNTRTGTKQVFTLPRSATYVRMYNCGPTVYGRQHIGNLSMFVFTDVLRRTLECNGFKVRQIINITDVGHLQSDADAGEDKMTLGLQREGLALTLENMHELAERYAAMFFDDLVALNVDIARIEFPRASQYLPAMIAMVKTLEEKGYAYRAQGGVYFDTSRFASYGALGGVNLAGQREGARVPGSTEKRAPTDFLLWKRDETIGWDSPWGKGFPGWHIECSAMIRSCLGQQIDIHTGGIEHIPIHHNNEIAQSEVATGRSPLSRFWLHRAHVQIDGGKIAKSQGNVVYLSDIVERGFDPLALRYLFLQAHYRSPSNFSWEALQGAQNSLQRLVALASRTPHVAAAPPPRHYVRAFVERINDDLDTPGALAVLWEMSKDPQLAPGQLLSGLEKMDAVLGLDLLSPSETLLARVARTVSLTDLPSEIRTLVQERERARAERNWKEADDIRAALTNKGVTVEDSEAGPRVSIIGPAGRN